MRFTVISAFSFLLKVARPEPQHTLIDGWINQILFSFFIWLFGVLLVAKLANLILLLNHNGKRTLRIVYYNLGE